MFPVHIPFILHGGLAPKIHVHNCYCRQYNFVVPAFFSFLGGLPLAWSIFFGKKMDDAQTHFGSMLCTSWGCNGHVTRLPLWPQHLHRITGPKVCMGSTKKSLGITTHILDRRKGSQGKTEASNTFVLHSITTRVCEHIMLGVGRWGCQDWATIFPQHCMVVIKCPTWHLQCQTRYSSHNASAMLISSNYTSLAGSRTFMAVTYIMFVPKFYTRYIASSLWDRLHCHK
jgi:hypothetical protein